MPKSTPQLFQYTVCPFCIKVRGLLNYKQIPYETIEVHPLKKKEIAFSDDYKKVPIFLNDEGKKIVNSTEIMRHIDKQWPEKKVFETDKEAKILEDQWLKWADESLVQALPPVMYKSLGQSVKAFDYITTVNKYSWWDRLKIKYAGAVVMMLVARKRKKQRGIKDPIAHLRGKLTEWEDAIRGKLYLNGQRPNGADFAIHGILSSVKSLPAFDLVKENRVVFDWFKKMEESIEPCSQSQ